MQIIVSSAQAHPAAAAAQVLPAAAAQALLAAVLTVHNVQAYQNGINAELLFRKCLASVVVLYMLIQVCRAMNKNTYCQFVLFVLLKVSFMDIYCSFYWVVLTSVPIL